MKLAARGDASFEERAERSLNFLLSVQLENGAFPGGEIANNTNTPSPFNTGQIINGLVEWHRHSNDASVLDAACRAADWLVSVQEPDGSFVKFFYHDRPAAYSAHLTCWLAQVGQAAGCQEYLDAAERHLDWVLGHHVAETGWFELAGFNEQQHQDRTGYTHTIAYTLWGVLYTSEILDRQDGIDAVAQAAGRILRRFELSRRLPGVLDWRWRSAADFSCLTGNAQMALIWFRLYELLHDPRYLNTAIKAIDQVKRAQSMDNPNPGIRGGIPGSDPIWGDYISLGIPNWAAKYFIDALLRKRHLLDNMPAASANWNIPDDVPRSLPEDAPASDRQPLRIAMVTKDKSTKVPQMLESWSDWKFKPDVVFVQERVSKGRLARLREAIRSRGWRAAIGRLFGRKLPAIERPSIPTPPPQVPKVGEYCSANKIRTEQIGSLDADATLDKIRAHQPDILIYAGGGILRRPILSIPRLGTLNTHMGLLPKYRGMNVAEWSAFNGDPLGCSVHLIDPGVDTGDLLCVREVSGGEFDSVAELRRAIDNLQIHLLGEVTRFIVNQGGLPPARPQALDEGVQYFRMHPEVTDILNEKLSATARSPVEVS